MVLPQFWKGKKVLVTGHTGFMGSWLSLWLIHLGAEVAGYSLDCNSDRNFFSRTGLTDLVADNRGDIRDGEKLAGVFNDFKPEVVFHLAAQPLVRKAFKEPVFTYETNVIGSLNLLECVKNCSSTRTAVMFTTDKCYEKKDYVWGYRENEPLGGYDPYSSSKAALEIAINSWRNSFFNPVEYANHGKAVVSLRSGNVFGGGDWAADRIMPDCISALEQGRSIEIRSPKSLISCEFVLEPLKGALMLAQKIGGNPEKFSGAWNFGPGHDSIISVMELAQYVVKHFGEGDIKDVSDMTLTLPVKRQALDTSKAQFLLDWRPVYDVDKALQQTVEWYRNCDSDEIQGLSFKQLESFMNQ